MSEYENARWWAPGDSGNQSNTSLTQFRDLVNRVTGGPGPVSRAVRALVTEFEMSGYFLDLVLDANQRVAPHFVNFLASCRGEDFESAAAGLGEAFAVERRSIEEAHRHMRAAFEAFADYQRERELEILDAESRRRSGDGSQ